MTLVSRYTPYVYLCGFILAAIITAVLHGMLGLSALIGAYDMAQFSVIGFYAAFANVSFYITLTISLVIGGYVVLVTAVQMAMVDFMSVHVDKERKEIGLLLRGGIMVFLTAVITLGTWALTRSALNVELGSSIWSEFFWGPVALGLIFVLVTYVLWPHTAKLASD